MRIEILGCGHRDIVNGTGQRTRHHADLTIRLRERRKMPALKETISKLSTAEKLQVMEFLWGALNAHYEAESPAWHDDVLAERVDAPEDEFEDWEDVKRELRSAAYAH